jgi:hypothetical protein
LPRDRLRIGREITEGLALVGFAIDKAAQIELPALVQVNQVIGRNEPLNAFGFLS